MSDSQSDALQRAYELVEAGQSDAARAILEPLVAAEPNNADAWWILAYAVEDPAEARAALNRVLELDPNYPEAGRLLADLDTQYPVAGAAAASFAAAPPPLPEEIGDVPPTTTSPLDEPDFLPPPAAVPAAPPQPPKRRRPSPFLWVAVLLALFLVLLGVIIFRPQPPLQVADAATFTAAMPSETIVINGEPTLQGQTLNDQGTPIVVLGVTPITLGDLTSTASTLGAQSADAAGTSAADLVNEASTQAALAATDAAALQATVDLTQVAILATLPGTAEAVLPSVDATLDTSAIATLPPDALVTPTAETFETDATTGGALPTADLLAASTESAEGALTAEPAETLSPEDEIAADLDSAQVVDFSIARVETNLGSALIVTVCSQEGLALRNALPAVMNAVGVNAQSLASDIDAVGAQIVSCRDASSTLRLVLVQRTIAEAYGAGAMTQAEYEATWISL